LNAQKDRSMEQVSLYRPVQWGGAASLIGLGACFARWMSTSWDGGWWRRIKNGILITAFGMGWYAGMSVWLLDHSKRQESILAVGVEAVVERIIAIESDGDANAKNKRSSATGLAQFLDATWLDLIRSHRPDLASGRSQAEILELRRDAGLAREMCVRFTRQNADLLRKRGVPVTPGTLYLAHFAGAAGAVAIVSALDSADAASVMAGADSSGRTRRERIVRANPFLERFTVVDLRNWADRKMGIRGS
jgi:hypothetical protein